MQDHYFKYVCTDGKTVFFALCKADLDAERNNDIDLYFEKCKKSDPDIKKSDLEQKYQIITRYPAKMSKSEIQQDLDLLGVPNNGTVTDADFQNIVNIINNAAGHPNVGNFD